MSTAELERVLILTRFNYMNNSGGILLLIQTLKDEKISVWSFIIHEIVSPVAGTSFRAFSAQNERIGLFADIALERLPVVRCKSRTVFHLLFDIEPAS